MYLVFNSIKDVLENRNLTKTEAIVYLFYH